MGGNVSLTDLINHLITRLFVEQSLAFSGSAKILKIAGNFWELLFCKFWVFKKNEHFFSSSFGTLNSSESIRPTPFSTGVHWNEEPSPEGQRDKEIILSQFISSLFDGVGQLLPGDFAGLLMCRPRLLAAGDSWCQKVLQRFSGSIQGVGTLRFFFPTPHLFNFSTPHLFNLCDEKPWRQYQTKKIQDNRLIRFNQYYYSHTFNNFWKCEK